MEKLYLTYELIDIEIVVDEVTTEDNTQWLCADDSADYSTGRQGKPIERDADGIPMGTSVPEIEEREAFISAFLEKWSADNSERKVYNDVLQEFIYVRAISIIEAKEHSAKSYNSTCAIKIIDEVLKNASPVGRVARKLDNRNQRDFEYMLVMVYRHADIGTVKLTLGVRKNADKIQYGLTALRPGQPLIDRSKSQAKKKRHPHV